MGKTEPDHGLTRRHGRVELLTDALENIALGNAADVAYACYFSCREARLPPTIGP